MLLFQWPDETGTFERRARDETALGVIRKPGWARTPVNMKDRRIRAGEDTININLPSLLPANLADAMKEIIGLVWTGYFLGSSIRV